MAKKQKTVDLAAAGFKVRKNFNIGLLPAAVTRTIAALNKLPFKELLTSRQLADLVKIQRTTMSCYSAHPELTPYRFDNGKPTQGVLWGSSKTMLELKRHLEKE